MKVNFLGHNIITYIHNVCSCLLYETTTFNVLTLTLSNISTTTVSVIIPHTFMNSHFSIHLHYPPPPTILHLSLSSTSYYPPPPTILHLPLSSTSHYPPPLTIPHLSLSSTSHSSDELGRVRLRYSHKQGSDYINASFIDVSNTPHTYTVSYCEIPHRKLQSTSCIRPCQE